MSNFKKYSEKYDFGFMQKLGMIKWYFIISNEFFCTFNTCKIQIKHQKFHENRYKFEEIALIYLFTLKTDENSVLLFIT